MEPRAALHPADETLVSYGLGKLDDTLAESVGKHLEQCDPCRQRVAELSSDSFLGRLQNAKLQQEAKPAVAQPVRAKTLVEADPPGPAPVGQKQASPKVPSSAATPSSRDSLPPELANHPQYEVIRELGRGGMGVVYLARNKLMDRLEVLKVLSKEMLGKQGRSDRFLREIQSAAKLHHPNVVAAYTAFPLGETLCFAMEYVEGDDLAKLVRARGPLPVLNACYFAYQTAQGLAHAHERGMIHRDIKPGNLILFRQGKKGTVKILDFGLAKVTSEQRIDGTLTQQGQMLGTPDYIAPEQTLDAQKADIRADIYSLGCTLYHLLTGSPPFSGNSLYQVLQAHHSVEARPLNLVRPEVPVELAAVVAKMMAKDPNRRYQTPAEVVQALKPFLKPGGLTSPQPELSQSVSDIERPSATPIAAAATPDEEEAPFFAPMEPVEPSERWKSLIDTPSLERLSTARSAFGKPPWRQPPWIWASVAIGLAVFGLISAWASGVFSVKTRDGVIVLQDLPDNAEVLVDGDKVRVRFPEGGGPAEITVPPGKRGVQVKKDGFQAFGDEVRLASGEKKLLSVRLDPLPEKASTKERAEVSKPLVEPKKTTASLGVPFSVRGDWLIENDELVQPTLAAGEEFFPLIVLGETSLSNYDLRLQVKKTGGHDALGVFFHWLGPGHRRTYCLAGNGGMDYCFLHNGRWGREPGNWKWLKFESNQWYSLTVEVRGETFKAYLDDVLQFEQTDPRFTRGRVCLYTWNATARFRRIKVSDPNGTVLFEGLPELPPKNSAVKSDRGPADSVPTAEEALAKREQQRWAERLGAATNSSNSIGMTLALIPPGQFQMGSPDFEHARRGNEQQHPVKITKPFYLGVNEVTQDEFQRVLERNPCAFSNSGGQSEETTGVMTRRYPVENVRWYDAIEFCNELSEKEGLPPYYKLSGIDRDSDASIKGANVTILGGSGYRLPTEAQWEYACRAGTTTPFEFGSMENGREVNCNGNVPYGTDERGLVWGHPVPVGGYRSNAFGLYDMHGNVWEWCHDWLDDNYYAISPNTDPSGPTSGQKRVVRGGGWGYAPADCRSGWHGWGCPPGDRWWDGGFRVARDVGAIRQAPDQQMESSERRDWRGSYSSFTVTEGRRWQEKLYDGSAAYQFDEVRRTTEYVELIDKTRGEGCRIRLRDDQTEILWRGRDRGWHRLQPGSWFKMTDAARAPRRTSTDGFVSLCNGQDLVDWTFPYGNQEKWTIENGVLHGLGGRIVSARFDYTDFHLRMWVRSPDQINKHLIFRSNDVNGEETNYRFALGGTKWDGTTAPLGTYALKTGGGLTAGNRVTTAGLTELKAVKTPLLEKDKWYRVEIVAVRNTFRMFLDGTEVSAFRDEQSRLPRGQIAIGVANGALEIRDIEINESPGKTVEPPRKPHVPKQRPVSTKARKQPAAKFVPLFNGKDLKGWSFPFENSAEWTVENKTLIGSARRSDESPPTALHLIRTSSSRYADFHLRLKVCNPDQINKWFVFRLSGPPDDMKYYRFDAGGEGAHKENFPLGRFGIKTGGVGNNGATFVTEGLGTITEPTAQRLAAADQFRKVEIIATKNEFQMLVDGQLVSGFRDEQSRLKNGAIAFVLRPGAHVEIRDIELQELEH